jgi:hypothetical protein
LRINTNWYGWVGELNDDVDVYIAKSRAKKERRERVKPKRDKAKIIRAAKKKSDSKKGADKTKALGEGVQPTNEVMEELRKYVPADEDACKILTGFTAKPGEIQQDYRKSTTRHVNRLPSKPPITKESTLKNLNGGRDTVTVPVLVVFRLDPNISFPIPGGEKDTGGVVAKYRDVVGLESGVPELPADASAHVINFRFGGKAESALGFDPNGKTNIIPLLSRINGKYTQADGQIENAIKGSGVPKGAACARITIEYYDDKDDTPYPARPKRVKYELYTQQADGSWLLGEDASEGIRARKPFDWWNNDLPQPKPK